MEEENSAAVEDDQRQDEFSLKKIRHRKKHLYKAIKNQMEFYFSDANLMKDRFLGNQIAEDPCKY
jgi:La-related protein 7